jgi:predicted RNase H-like HicB family nuclease
MGFRYRIHLHHDGKRYVADVPELPGCQGSGKTYGEALQAAESAIAVRIQSPLGIPAMQPTSRSQLRAVLPGRPVAARKHGPVKIRLVEKYGNLSNRQLAAEIGLFARDAPVMLSAALGGNGTRQVRCAIAIALNELPSILWPNLPSLTKAADDKIYIAATERLSHLGTPK